MQVPRSRHLLTLSAVPVDKLSSERRVSTAYAIIYCRYMRISPALAIPRTMLFFVTDHILLRQPSSQLKPKIHVNFIKKHVYDPIAFLHKSS